MPVIRIDTNVSVGPAAQAPLLADLSRLAAQLLAKPEAYVLVHLHPGQAMVFGGTDAPMAYVEAKSIGLTPADCPRLSKALTAFLAERLNIDPARIYIEFASPAGEMWGWNGETF